MGVIRGRTRFGLVALSGVLALAVAPGGAVSATTTANHYQCYVGKFEPRDDAAKALATYPENVTLNDINHANDYAAGVIRPRMFCNPVRKTFGDVVSPIAEPDWHLKGYDVSGGWFSGGTLIQNQFGGPQGILYAGPVMLLVPTKKADHQAPTGLDHYACYAAKTDPANATVRLKDQWGKRQTTVLDPRLFCFPTDKAHGTVDLSKINTGLFYLCYRTEAAKLNDPPRVRLENQFGVERFTPKTVNMLCVPTDIVS